MGSKNRGFNNKTTNVLFFFFLHASFFVSMSHFGPNEFTSSEKNTWNILETWNICAKIYTLPNNSIPIPLRLFLIGQMLYSRNAELWKVKAKACGLRCINTVWPREGVRRLRKGFQRRFQEGDVGMFPSDCVWARRVIVKRVCRKQSSGEEQTLMDKLRHVRKTFSHPADVFKCLSVARRGPKLNPCWISM